MLVFLSLDVRWRLFYSTIKPEVLYFFDIICSAEPAYPQSVEAIL